jgi:simple sugar transport system permease protein
VTVAESEARVTRPPVGRRLAVAFFSRREASILLVTIGLILYFALQREAFYEADNARTIAERLAPLALIAAGEVMLLICGEIDLSPGFVYALSPFVVFFSSNVGIPIGIGVVLALVVAALVGLTNGVITVFFGVPSFITTLGMAFLLNGITLTTSKGIQVLMPGGETFTKILADPEPIPGVPLPATFLWALGIILAVHVALTRTRWGLYTIATGGNLVGASESGVNVRGVKIGNFVLCSVLGGFAGILESTRITSILPLQGGYPVMFLAVAGAVIGGTSLFGGLGTITGAFLGVLVLVILENGFNIIGVSAFKFNIVIGSAILVAMALNVYIARVRTVGRFEWPLAGMRRSLGRAR